MSEPLESYLIDMDGVLVHEENALPGADEFIRRLGEAGWANVYVPSSVITHLGGHATSRAAGPMQREHHRALFRYLSRQYAGPAYAPVRLVLGVGLLLRYLLAARVRSIGEGAAPTRPASVLEDP